MIERLQLQNVFVQRANFILPFRSLLKRWTFRNWSLSIINFVADPDQGQRDRVRQRDHVLQGDREDKKPPQKQEHKHRTYRVSIYRVIFWMH